MLKKKLLLVLAVWLPCYSYSDSIAPYYGYTDNAASQALRWSMQDVFPSPPGLSVNAVLYRYTPLKLTEDSMIVHVQNENALGDGYIFRETDDWSGKEGGTEIRKVIGLPNVPRELWGDGSIEVEGNGTVTEASVVYSYRVDPCYDPQFDPNCPGYQRPIPDTVELDYDLYDATEDADNTQYNPDDELYEDEEAESEEEKAEREAEEEKDSRERLEKALSAADNSMLFANALATSQMLDTVNMATNMNAYYQTNIQGGVYRESISLQDKQLPENRQGLRNGLAQQLLHEKMIEMQYNKNK